MIPILFYEGEEKFTTNGIGRLVDCISCKVTEERNGIYECQFRYPISGQHYADIREGRYICVIHDDTKKPQPFEIYKRQAPLDGVVTFYAHHYSYKLGRIVANPFTATSCAHALASIHANCSTDCNFTFWTDKDVSGNFALDIPMPVKQMLGGVEGSILDVYGTGEYEWDINTVKLHLNRGEDKPVEIRYGKNLTKLNHEKDKSATYSAAVPYWTDGEGELVMLPEKVVYSDEYEPTEAPWTTETGAYITDENDEPIEFAFEQVEVAVMDLSERWENAPTEEQLRNACLAQMRQNKPYLPSETIDVDFIQLWQTDEYKAFSALQRVSLCDRISVIYPEMGLKAIKMKVVKVVYDSLLERYDSMTLGQVQTSFAKVVAADTEEAVMKRVPTKTYLDAAIDAATTLLAGGTGGYVVINRNADGTPNEILVMDTDNIETAVNILRINRNGIGFSHTGYSGQYTSAWTIDGHFVADFIDTGTLSATLLKTGIITDRQGKNYWNLETGEISISIDPGEAGAVTPADLARVENNARAWAEDAEENAKSYVDEQDFETAAETTAKITAKESELDTKYGVRFAAKGDTVTGTVTYYYKSTSPTQLFGGSWGIVNPGWEDGFYLWQKVRYLKADGTYTESEPICITGNTGQGEKGEDGADALYLWISSNAPTAVAKGTTGTATLTAHVAQGDSDDIDPSGNLKYAWYYTMDGGTEGYWGKTKNQTITINQQLCEDRGSMRFTLVDDAAFYYLTDEDGNALTNESNTPLEVA